MWPWTSPSSGDGCSCSSSSSMGSLWPWPTAFILLLLPGVFLKVAAHKRITRLRAQLLLLLLLLCDGDPVHTNRKRPSRVNKLQLWWSNLLHYLLLGEEDVKVFCVLGSGRGYYPLLLCSFACSLSFFITMGGDDGLMSHLPVRALCLCRLYAGKVKKITTKKSLTETGLALKWRRNKKIFIELFKNETTCSA